MKSSISKVVTLIARVVSAKPVLSTPSTGGVKGKEKLQNGWKKLQDGGGVAEGNWCQKRQSQERTRSVSGEGLHYVSRHGGCSSKTCMSENPGRQVGADRQGPRNTS